MKLFSRRKPAPLPERSVEVRQEAEAQQQKANALLAAATAIADKARTVREENHIAEAIMYAHRSSK